jgi:hypothetical protein
MQVSGIGKPAAASRIKLQILHHWTLETKLEYDLFDSSISWISLAEDNHSLQRQPCSISRSNADQNLMMWRKGSQLMMVHGASHLSTSMNQYDMTFDHVWRIVETWNPISVRS